MDFLSQVGSELAIAVMITLGLILSVIVLGYPFYLIKAWFDGANDGYSVYHQRRYPAAQFLYDSGYRNGYKDLKK